MKKVQTLTAGVVAGVALVVISMVVVFNSVTNQNLMSPLIPLFGFSWFVVRVQCDGQSNTNPGGRADDEG